jgi:hypothetical protein
MGDGASAAGSVTFQACLERSNREMACRAAILKARLHRIDLITPDGHCKGTRPSNMVGTNSETVGWICIARCRTVDGAFAYMVSRMQ